MSTNRIYHKLTELNSPASDAITSINSMQTNNYCPLKNRKLRNNIHTYFKYELLSNDIKIYLLSYLTIEDVLSLSTVNKKNYDLISSMLIYQINVAYPNELYDLSSRLNSLSNWCKYTICGTTWDVADASAIACSFSVGATAGIATAPAYYYTSLGLTKCIESTAMAAGSKACLYAMAPQATATTCGILAMFSCFNGCAGVSKRSEKQNIKEEINNLEERYKRVISL